MIFRLEFDVETSLIKKNERYDTVPVELNFLRYLRYGIAGILYKRMFCWSDR